MKLGFVGTGTITAAIVDGLAAAGTDLSIALSPRNTETAAALAAITITRLFERVGTAGTLSLG